MGGALKHNGGARLHSLEQFRPVEAGESKLCNLASADLAMRGERSRGECALPLYKAKLYGAWLQNSGDRRQPPHDVLCRECYLQRYGQGRPGLYCTLQQPLAEKSF